jgi:pilus assembly protein CpaC
MCYIKPPSARAKLWVAISALLCFQSIHAQPHSVVAAVPDSDVKPVAADAAKPVTMAKKIAAAGAHLSRRSMRQVSLAPVVPELRKYLDDTMLMHSGEVAVLDVGNVDRVAVGNGKIATTTVLDGNRLLIIAQDVGDTNIIVWDGRRQAGNFKLRVTAVDMKRVKAEIVALLADVRGVSVMTAGDRIFIDGDKLSPDDQARVQKVAQQYPNVTDRTSGTAKPPVPASPSTMVMFDLYFLEYKKNYMQDMGVSWQKSANGFNFGAFAEAGHLANVDGGGSLGVRSLGPTGASSFAGLQNFPKSAVRGLASNLSLDLNVSAAVNLAVSSGQATLLASPKLAVRSGGVAKFIAGGEVPFQVAGSGNSGPSVQFKEYGIILEVEPKVNADNTVSGVIRTEVSQIDTASGTAQGTPGFTKRRTETDFFTPMGEAIVISGLYSQDLSDVTDKVPFLGDIPILNWFFSNKGEKRRNTELVVFIVPRKHSSQESMNKEVIRESAALAKTMNSDILGYDILPKLKFDSNIWHGFEGDYTKSESRYNWVNEPADLPY